MIYNSYISISTEISLYLSIYPFLYLCSYLSISVYLYQSPVYIWYSNITSSFVGSDLAHLKTRCGLITGHDKGGITLFVNCIKGDDILRFLSLIVYYTAKVSMIATSARIFSLLVDAVILIHTIV